MRRLSLVAPAFLLPLLVGCQNSGGPAAIAGKLGPGESFAVAIEQDGKAVPVRDHRVRVRGPVWCIS